MRVLLTGAAGFIGAATAHLLLARGDEVVGFDNLGPYYDTALKEARLGRLRRHRGFEFVRGDLCDRAAMDGVFRDRKPDRVVHLAAQAGVRHSIDNPRAFVGANVVGFLNVLEAIRAFGTEHLVYASSSSVYGSRTRLPFAVEDGADHPVSLYAATKKSNEAMAHAYSHLFGMPTTGLRFFTVYGPWGRPDMALSVFARKMLAGEPIDVFNAGRHTRDFTYIDDVAEGVVRTLDRVAAPDPEWDARAPSPASSSAPYRLYNVGSNAAVDLTRCIALLEEGLGVRARQRLLPMQAGDVADTFADVASLEAAVGYRPRTPVEVGIKRFVAWYRSYYRAE